MADVGQGKDKAYLDLLTRCACFDGAVRESVCHSYFDLDYRGIQECVGESHVQGDVQQYCTPENADFAGLG